jgi:hypothetical protein
MKTNSKKNPAPLAPTSTAPGNAAQHTVAKPEKGTLMKKKNTAAGDPTKMAKPSRTFVKADGHRAGARYGVRVGFQKQEAPEAGATQGNGRLIPPAINRSKPNFTAGMAE